MRNRIIHLIAETARYDPTVLFLTGDLGFSVVEPLQKLLGPRFLNAGVAEANMISMASTLAACGFRTFAYSITPFITARCYEQIRNDLCYPKRPVKLIGIGAGFAYGTLGPTHHALEDANILAALPNMVLISPGTMGELERGYTLTLNLDLPVYFRLGRDTAPDSGPAEFTLNEGVRIVREGSKINLVTSGTLLGETLLAAERLDQDGFSAHVLSIPVLSPFPQQALAARLIGGPVISVFEGFPHNPLESGLMTTLLAMGHSAGFRALHAPCAFAAIVGKSDSLRTHARLDAMAIEATAHQLLET